MGLEICHLHGDSFVLSTDLLFTFADGEGGEEGQKIGHFFVDVINRRPLR